MQEYDICPKGTLDLVVKLDEDNKQIYEVLKEVRDFIKDEYECEKSKALVGEFVSKEARYVWKTVNDSLSKSIRSNYE